MIKSSELDTKCFFITGTDTDSGKTICSKALLETASALGYSTVAYKPIAAGCETINKQLCNSDALLLKTSSSVKLNYTEVNPIAFEPAIAPHIAASIENKFIDFNLLTNGLNTLKSKSADLCFIEGAGGWRLPVDNTRYLSDWVVEQNLDVILVVGMKLGCLNHAILTYQAIIQDGLNVVGWIANSPMQKMPYYDDNLNTLKAQIQSPLIAELTHLDDPVKNNLTEYVNHAEFTMMIER